MPGLPDLELNEFDLKPYMDPNLLLDTFSSEDMDIWQNYNLFADDNINASLKDSIKEENNDLMDCCFSSICPNDLINNMDELELHKQKNLSINSNDHINNVKNNGNHYDNHNKNNDYNNISTTNIYDKQVIIFGDEGYSVTSSCTSSLSSSTAASPNFDDIKSSTINLDSIDFPPCLLNDNNSNSNNGKINSINSSNFDTNFSNSIANSDELSTSLQPFDPINLNNSDNISASSSSMSTMVSSNTNLFGICNENDTKNFPSVAPNSSLSIISSSSASASLSSNNSNTITPSSNNSIEYILNNIHNYQITTTKLNENNNKVSTGLYQIQKSNKQNSILKAQTNTSSTTPVVVTTTSSQRSQNLISTQLSNQSSVTPIIIVDSSKGSLKHQLSNLNSSQKIKKANILPPSPPSSLGSDGESNHSSSSSASSASSAVITTDTTVSSNFETAQKTTTIAGITSKTNKPSSILKSSTNNKLNSLKSSNVLKQARHQPYSNRSGGQNSSSSSSSSSSKHSTKHVSSKGSNSDDDCWPFLCSLSKLPTSGPLLLTEEEKRTLVQEGHQVPSQLPLSKGEEKILKKIRRKIKNKISAQESRRKKKEYVDSLEKRMDNYIKENVELKKKLEDLELNNKSLLSQLQKMQESLVPSESSVNVTNTNTVLCNNNLNDSTNNSNVLNPNTGSTSSSNQFGTLLMVLVLFFAVVLGVWSPVFTKDQIANSAAATAAAAASSSSRSPANSISTSTSTSTATAAIAIAAAAAAVATVKSESISPSPSPSPSSSSNHMHDGELQQSQEQQHFEHSYNFIKSSLAVDESSSALNSDLIRPASPYSSQNLKQRMLLPTNDEELMSIDNSSSGQGHIVTCLSPINNSIYDIVGSTSAISNQVGSSLNNTNLTARSKTGTAVELTKVRPFIRKLPSIQKTNTTISSSNLPLISSCHAIQNTVLSSPNSNLSTSSQPSEYIIVNNSNEEAQIIILNLASNNSPNTIPNSISNNCKLANVVEHHHQSETKLSSSVNGNILPVTLIGNSKANTIGSTTPLLSLNGMSVSNSNTNAAGNFRVINTAHSSTTGTTTPSKLSSNNTNSTTSTTSKLPTRFRLINNSITFNSHHSPSVIKLNSSS